MSYSWETSRGYKPLAQWINAGSGWVPQQGSNQAIIGGYDVSGENLYIGRTNHQGDIIPGKVVQSHGVCYVPYGGEEHGKTTYQVLVHDANSGTDFVWVKAENGAVPTGAIQGGVGSDGERFFIGRVRHEGALCIGKVHPSHRNMVILITKRFVCNIYH